MSSLEEKLTALSERDRNHYLEKAALRHKGPCSGPHLQDCECPSLCPNKGSCCDCVQHHVRMQEKSGKQNLPYCLKKSLGMA